MNARCQHTLNTEAGGLNASKWSEGVTQQAYWACIPLVNKSKKCTLKLSSQLNALFHLFYARLFTIQYKDWTHKTGKHENGLKSQHAGAFRNIKSRCLLCVSPGYHTLFAVFAVRCLPHHTFLQYIDHGFLQLTETFVSRLMTGRCLLSFVLNAQKFLILHWFRKKEKLCRYPSLKSEVRREMGKLFWTDPSSVYQQFRLLITV